MKEGRERTSYAPFPRLLSLLLFFSFSLSSLSPRSASPLRSCVGVTSLLEPAGPPAVKRVVLEDGPWRVELGCWMDERLGGPSVRGEGMLDAGIGGSEGLAERMGAIAEPAGWLEDLRTDQTTTVDRTSTFERRLRGAAGE